MAYGNRLKTLIIQGTGGRIVLNGNTGQIEIYSAAGALVGLIDGTGIYAMSGMLGSPDAYARLFVSGTQSFLELRPKDTAENEAFNPGQVLGTWNDETDEAGQLFLFPPNQETIIAPVPTLLLQAKGNTSLRTLMRATADDTELDGQLALDVSNPNGAWSRGANLSIADGVITDITFPAEQYDTDGMLTPTSAVCTVPLDGKYDIKGWAAYAAGGVGYRSLAISKNNGTAAGTNFWHDTRPPAGAAAETGMNIGATLELTAGDTVRLKTQHTQGAALNIIKARLSVERRPGTTTNN